MILINYKKGIRYLIFAKVVRFECQPCDFKFRTDAQYEFDMDGVFAIMEFSVIQFLKLEIKL